MFNCTYRTILDHHTWTIKGNASEPKCKYSMLAMTSLQSAPCVRKWTVTFKKRFFFLSWRVWITLMHSLSKTRTHAHTHAPLVGGNLPLPRTPLCTPTPTRTHTRTRTDTHHLKKNSSQILLSFEMQFNRLWKKLLYDNLHRGPMTFCRKTFKCYWALTCQLTCCFKCQTVQTFSCSSTFHSPSRIIQARVEN